MKNFIIRMFLLLSGYCVLAPHETMGQSQSSPGPKLVEITIFADKDLGEAPPLQGFLTGIGHRKGDQFDRELVRALHPQSWRIPDWVYYDKVKEYHPRITFILGEQYANTHGGWNKAKPWSDWDGWEAFVKQTVEDSKKQNRPVDFWDVWGEPDLGGGTPWKGSYSELLEFFARTIKTVHAVDPKAMVVGPSVSEFTPRFKEGEQTVSGLDTFISDLDRRHHVRLDALSWHELGSLPENVPANADTLRAFLEKSFPGYRPPLHVNEFTSGPEHLVPGWTVGWLYYLEKAEIDSANRACWSVAAGRARTWSDCWAGLNGLLMNDNKTPQAIYWVHLAYGQMEGKRLLVEPADARTVALARKKDRTKEIALLVGRLDSRTKVKDAPRDVTVTVKNYPFGGSAVRVEFQRIPNEGPGTAMSEAPVVDSKSIPVQKGTVVLEFKDFQDGDAYAIVMRPEHE